MSKARDLASAAPAPSTVSATELGYLDGVTSAVQTQINTKIGQETAINPSTVTTKGDILVATGSGTIVRQGVGTDGQVLVADSAQADGVNWATPAAGGMTLLSTTTLSGATTTISSINQSYNNLQILVYGVNNATANYYFQVQPNASTIITSTSGTFQSTANGLASGTIRLYNAANNTGLQANATNNGFQINISNYANTTNYKPLNYYGFVLNPTNGNALINQAGAIQTNSAITSLLFFAEAGSFTGGTVLIYGVK